MVILWKEQGQYSLSLLHYPHFPVQVAVIFLLVYLFMVISMLLKVLLLYFSLAFGTLPQLQQAAVHLIFRSENLHFLSFVKEVLQDLLENHWHPNPIARWVEHSTIWGWFGSIHLYIYCTYYQRSLVLISLILLNVINL